MRADKIFEFFINFTSYDKILIRSFIDRFFSNFTHVNFVSNYWCAFLKMLYLIQKWIFFDNFFSKLKINIWKFNFLILLNWNKQKSISKLILIFFNFWPQFKGRKNNRWYFLKIKIDLPLNSLQLDQLVMKIGYLIN